MHRIVDCVDNFEDIFWQHQWILHCLKCISKFFKHFEISIYEHGQIDPVFFMLKKIDIIQGLIIFTIQLFFIKWILCTGIIIKILKTLSKCLICKNVVSIVSNTMHSHYLYHCITESASWFLRYTLHKYDYFVFL